MQNERETHTEHRVGVDILVQKRGMGMGMVVDLDRWFGCLGGSHSPTVIEDNALRSCEKSLAVYR